MGDDAETNQVFTSSIHNSNNLYRFGIRSTCRPAVV